ncbi:MAG TPA: DUF4249 domain-containing protein [Prolixibacteraceae bacterium]
MLIYRNILLFYQKIKTVLFLLVCLTAFQVSMVSCEKVVSLNLNDAVPRVVIQGNIYDQPGPFYVKISKSVNFDESNNYPPVTGASVEITDNMNQTEILTESAAGTYNTSKLRGIPGRNYSLTVKTGSDIYQSVAFMPTAVAIDSIYFASSPFSGEKTTTVRFNDPPYTRNFYRLVYFINNVQLMNFYVLDDELFQGASIKYALSPRESELKLAKGDLVTVWLESIDKGVFEYFRTVGHENGQSTSPSNPVSNISNGALGYFNASSVRKISLIVDK